ncbi:hypothetical protein ACIG8K_02810 [Streptomyces halstedii]|uniref:hypothetical protein n=1 Tax=Streptomyces halstedii TaxID=1944 RepID=UPI0037CD38BE
MARINYTNEEKRAYLDIASEVGHPKAMRTLGYPSSWNTANGWARDFGVSIALDELKARAAAHRDWYGDDEHMEALQVAIDRAMDFLDKNPDLTADEYKKVMDGLTKAIDKQRVIQGKTTSRTTTEASTPTDTALQNLVRAFENGEQNTSDPRHQEVS